MLDKYSVNKIEGRIAGSMKAIVKIYIQVTCKEDVVSLLKRAPSNLFMMDKFGFYISEGINTYPLFTSCFCCCLRVLFGVHVHGWFSVGMGAPKSMIRPQITPPLHTNCLVFPIP